MFSAAFRVGLISLLLATAACTQEPAKIDMRGQQFFGRNGVSGNSQPSYSAKRVPNTDSFAKSDYKPYQPAPVYTNTPRPTQHVSDATQQTAAVQSIGVSDLPPPAATKSSSTNGWTKKSRSDETQSVTIKPQTVAAAKAPAQKPQKFASGRETSSLMWPVNSHRVISGYGPKGAGKANDGINIASAEGEPVWASADGEVVYSGNELSSYGNMVLIKHPGNKTTTYAHMSRITVDKYDRVKQGDIIGYVGSTGNVKAPQLHFAVRNGKDPVDPKKYLSTSVAGL